MHLRQSEQPDSLRQAQTVDGPTVAELSTLYKYFRLPDCSILTLIICTKGNWIRKLRVGGFRVRIWLEDKNQHFWTRAVGATTGTKQVSAKSRRTLYSTTFHLNLPQQNNLSTHASNQLNQWHNRKHTDRPGPPQEAEKREARQTHRAATSRSSLLSTHVH